MSLMAAVDASVKVAGLQDLTIHRSVSSVPFAGRYRLIDFPLSNIVNADINSVGIFASPPFASLIDHIGVGKSWDLDRRKEGLFFLPTTHQNGGIATVGSFRDFEDHIQFFEKSRQTHVVVTSSFVVGQLDYKEMLAHHLAAGTDITEAVGATGSLKSYILSRRLMLELIRSYREKRILSVEDLVNLKKAPYTYGVYEYKGYFAIIDSIQQYFKESLGLLDENNRRLLFLPQAPIYTKVKDEPPTRYLDGSSVSMAMIANGSTILGTVKNSVISRAVTIGINAKLDKCVIMQKCNIEENCELAYVIADKDVHIEKGVRLIGTQEQPIVLRKGERVTKEDSR